MHDKIESLFREVLPKADFCSLRYVHEHEEMVGVRQGVPEPAYLGDDAGVMITVVDKGGMGYAATSDCSRPRPARGPGGCLLYTSPSPRDRTRSRMPSSA